MKIAPDPIPFHRSHGLLDFAQVAADLGSEWMQLTPYPDFSPFFSHRRAVDAPVGQVKKSVADTAIGISALCPVQRGSAADDEARRAVRAFVLPFDGRTSADQRA